MLFLIGLAGLLGLIFSWPIQILWLVLLCVGWGVLVIDGDIDWF